MAKTRVKLSKIASEYIYRPREIRLRFEVINIKHSFVNRILNIMSDQRKVSNIIQELVPDPNVYG